MYRSSFIKVICYKGLLALLVVSTLSLHAQTNRAITEAEEQLKELFDMMISSDDDEVRINSGVNFSALFHQTLTLDGSFKHPFSLLSNLSKLTSSDEKLRIFTWNLPLHSGMNRFYGLIQINSTETDPLIVVDLMDQGDKIANPEAEILFPEMWYGAIYYKLITLQTVYDQVFYTLLGWRGENMLMTSRLIDILTISSAGEISFGKTVFCDYAESKPTRILFRHSANVTMSLRYEEQSVATNKKWHARRKEFSYKREKAWLIVCDRLVPANPQLEGQYEYYIPAGDVMDGFIFKEGCWNFIKQIDARNP